MASKKTKERSIDALFTELADILNKISDPCIQTMMSFNVDYFDIIDKNKTAEIVNKGKLPSYLEIHHSTKVQRLINENSYFSISTIKI